ncbi:MAG: toll/interleukin-1 receptor domain-containing protein [Lewinellaceae bacterium]|nr:toll/interleukin-1 receptor domain-containing protein [Lewinellaceae bacterium]
MAYEYDVFISYRSKSKLWLREIFLPDFIHYLEEEVDGNLSYFVDWHDIRTGDDWEQRLKYALIKSKCLISFLIPTYFDSDWCKKEFAVFEHRSRQSGMLSLKHPEGLIIPVTLHGNRPFPDPVRLLQTKDYKYYYSASVEGYKKTKKYQKLQDQLKSLAQEVGNKISSVPGWNPVWQQKEWYELPIQHLQTNKIIVPQPKI